MDINNNISAFSDKAIISKIAEFVKHHRISQNLSQEKLAISAGLNRTTIRDVEQGKNTSLLTLIQILRILDQLHIFNQFEIIREFSPMELAKLQIKERKRAYKSNKETKQSPEW